MMFSKVSFGASFGGDLGKNKQWKGIGFLLFTM
jgi:hypothetical protein